MNSDEIIEMLKEFHNTRYDKLEGESKRLFDAIMKIADERDMYKQETKQLKEKENKIIKLIKSECIRTDFNDNILKILSGDNNG